ncbi:MAG: DUF420 domain-containing protein [Planctomycetes bacterium]|nr:DUF420 domain-containing protein [Planctomycetota bacterium]
MLPAGTLILILKIAVVAVTVLLVGSLTALARGNYTLHGRINMAVFALTMTALLGLEVIARIISPDIFNDHFERYDAKSALRVHLCFSLPSAALLPLMLFTGLRRRRSLHVPIGVVFLALWTGTFVTGVFFLPHDVP